MGCETYNTRLAYSVTIRISAQNNFILLLKHFITKVLEYKMGLKGRIKFVCVAMCSLVMSLCSRDLHVTLFCTVRVFYTVRVWYIPYVYGMYHTRTVQFCIPYAYGMTIRVWYVPYAYNDVLRADSMSHLLECI